MTTNTKSPQYRKEVKLERYIYYGLRGITRFLTIPITFFPESKFKDSVRSTILNIQHSLPTELSVNRGDTVVQIGTPWPKTLHRFRKAIGKTGKLIIFEAEPTNFSNLKQASDKADYDNVFLINGAAWSENKQGQLSISPYSGDHKIHQDSVDMDNDLRPGNISMDTIDVEFYRIDDALAELGISSINYLSVTVNGAEFEVLKGSEKTLKASNNIRVYAKGHARLANGQPLHSVIAPYLTSLGFKTKITRGEPSSTKDNTWLWRSGDVYAWKRTK